MKIILASQSPYRKALLERLKLDFTCFATEIDEALLPGESAKETVVRLAKSKALTAQENHPEAVCIGSDTVATIHDEILGKPGNLQKAVSQLKKFSGHEATFLTSVCVIGPHGSPIYCDVVPSAVQFKKLTEDQIYAYCEMEQPYQSSGSFKSETIACVLIERLTSDDPTAIIGLPLIRLSAMLEKVGVELL